MIRPCGIDDAGESRVALREEPSAGFPPLERRSGENAASIPPTV